jgi:hypothetical protein
MRTTKELRHGVSVTTPAVAQLAINKSFFEPSPRVAPSIRGDVADGQDRAGSARTHRGRSGRQQSPGQAPRQSPACLRTKAGPSASWVASGPGSRALEGSASGAKPRGSSPGVRGKAHHGCTATPYLRLGGGYRRCDHAVPDRRPDCAWCPIRRHERVPVLCEKPQESAVK